MSPPRPTLVDRVLVWLLMSGLLGPRSAAKVSAWVGERPQARARYGAQRAADRLASRGPLGPAQRDFLEALVLEAAAPPARARRRPWLAPMAVGAAATAGLLAVAQVHDSGRTLSARSAGEGALGLRVRCLDALEGGRWALVDGAVASPGGPTDALRCPSGAVLAWSGTNLQNDTRHVFVVGVTDEDELRWYPPFEPSSSSVALASGSVDDLLETLADTSAFASEPRNITLFVLFPDEPLRGVDVEERFYALKARGHSHLSALSRLPVGIDEQGRVDFLRVDR